jgi:Short C-terminal domain
MNDFANRAIPAVFLLFAAWVPLAVAPALARASTAQEEARGAKLVREIESGKLRCEQAGGDDFELIGEYAMGRMFASPEQHEAMNQMMVRMMGSAGESRVHEAMGRRFAGCGGGQLPPNFGRMMGAVNAMGMMGGGMMGGGSYGGPGAMMGGGFFNGPGGMMSRFASSDDDDFDGPSAAAMLGIMAVLIGAVAVALFWFARRGGAGPAETLQRRFARGEISAEEYEERRRLLGGG